jgi:hypothetical protein
MLVQRSGSAGHGTIMFVQNNFYFDAFFLKAIGKVPLPSPRVYSVDLTT